MNELITELKNKTKDELADIITALIEQYNIDIESLKKYITANDLDPFEENIILKFKNKETLTEEEMHYVQDCVSKKSNIKIHSLLKGNKFIAFLVEYKLKIYFNKTWQLYPRKVGKELGFKAYCKLLGEKKLKDLDSLANYITQRIIKYSQSCSDNNTEEQYILHFSTFCNSKKYL